LSSIYEVPVDPNAENNSHAYSLSYIGYNKTVLEVGCSTGFFTKALVERGCDVVGIELDTDAAKRAEQWADRVVVGNIDSGGVWDEVKDESFDVVVLGDVLEHLRDPLASLRQAVKKIKPSGFVVTSLPNFAHGDVRLALLQGRFKYGDWGILDKTHLHFFTIDSMRTLLVEAGLVPVETKRVIMPLFQSELEVRREDVHPEVVDELLMDPEAETYQVVMKSVRDNGTRTQAELSRRVNELSDLAHAEWVRTASLRAAVREAADIRAEGESLIAQLAEHQRYISALEGHVSGLEHNIEILTQSINSNSNEVAEANARYEALLHSRAMRMTAPVRWVHRKVRRTDKRAG
jgi:2-polyprenyl-3-methyl-5-hydroxy-6-metoxy-1,4-benzoquinol methylase